MNPHLTKLAQRVARPQLWVALIILVACMINLGSELNPVLLMIGIWGIAGVGLGLVLGFAGQISLCQAAFVGVGAYGYAILTTRFEAPPMAAAVGGAVTAALLAAAISPILRIRGYYLAIATIVLNLLLSALAISSLGVPGGSSGLAGIPYLEVLGYRLDTVEQYAALSLAVLAIFAVAAHWRYGRGHRWRAIQALRHDEGLAAGMGLNVVGLKRELFTVSGCAAGLAGALLAAAYGFISPGQFSYADSFTLALAVFIGGSLSLWGAVLGVALLEASAPLLGDAGALHGLLVGVVALLTVRFAPDGWITRRETVEDPDTMPEEPPLDSIEVGAHRAGASLATERISRSFGLLRALDEVSIDVAAGRVVGLIGPNGAGKTTFLNVIAGEVAPSSGDVFLDDQRISGAGAFKLARLGMVRTYQQSRIIAGLSVLENILVGVDALVASGAARPSAADQQRMARAAARDAGAARLLGKPTASLTFGERRLVELARLLVSQPRLALLDEPFSGLSQAEGLALSAVIRTLRERGTTVILVEHAIPFVLSLADDLVVLREGAVLAAGDPSTVIALDAVRDSYLGTAMEEHAS